VHQSETVKQVSKVWNVADYI